MRIVLNGANAPSEHPQRVHRVRAPLRSARTARSWHGGSIGLVLSLAFACDADLETRCVDGECTGPTTGAGGATPFVCEQPDTFGLPCDVYTVLADVCQDCHVEGGIGPFVLRTYEDTQADFFGQLVWVRMQRATADTDPPPLPAMPQGAHPLPKAQLDALTAWFATCEAGTCATGQGIGAAGGAGGTQ
jgi:hypothetical protein